MLLFYCLGKEDSKTNKLVSSGGPKSHRVNPLYARLSHNNTFGCYSSDTNNLNYCAPFNPTSTSTRPASREKLLNHKAKRDYK